MADRAGRRGSYAKGVAKREEILDRALEVVAREGYRGASVKELAEAVGLSQAGLLHYFDSKEELFTEILRKRDEVDSERFGRMSGGDLDFPDMRRGYVEVVRHNADLPGLVQLFSRMSVDATDPEHPAHRFFLVRGAKLRETFRGAIRSAQDEGRITSAVDAETLARIFQAVSDGMQVQWMLDPDVDMAVTVEALFTALAPTGNEPGSTA